ncbi:helix-turn-helix transcriptional regulator [Streptodolium elevatio]|uniref:Helix-turn-helix transcriptional regulator n=1 Tax=Streptodolium elevatio TaxID=3157996 RepID=A0ABV3DTE2_9ACTN
MTPVFGHGRLRLYLLKLLDESPRHGYEIIRLLQDRFLGLYAPSAGTVYPRLAKLEQEGLVTHSVEGGRKVYRITDAGRAELGERQAELDALETEIRESVYERAREIRDEVRTSARNLRDELRQAARDVRDDAHRPGGGPGGRPTAPPWRVPGGGGKDDPMSAWAKSLGPALSQKMVDLAEGLAQGLAGLTEQRAHLLEEEIRRRFGPDPETDDRSDPWAAETDPTDETGGAAAASGPAKTTDPARGSGGDGPRPGTESDPGSGSGSEPNPRPGAKSGGGKSGSGKSGGDTKSGAGAKSGPRGGGRHSIPDLDRHVQRLFDRFRTEIDTAAGHAGLTPSQVDRARDVLVQACSDLKTIFDEH